MIPALNEDGDLPDGIHHASLQDVLDRFAVQNPQREHGHDPAGCDLIVCWEHDWPECPLEVIELRSVIDRLEG